MLKWPVVNVDRTEVRAVLADDRILQTQGACSIFWLMVVVKVSGYAC